MLLERVFDIELSEQIAKLVVDCQPDWRPFVTEDYQTSLPEQIEWWQKTFAQDDFVGIARDKDASVQAAVSFYSTDRSEFSYEKITVPTAVLTKFYVAKAKRGSNFSSDLMTETLAEITDAGFREVRLWYITGYTPAERFYKKTGWTETGRTRIGESLLHNEMLIRLGNS